ncbi:MAG: hypothetical protein LC135_11285 [Phycisphaerae bacterium]|nr:hypothetical protein [Phycisphaerae bacterium]MCZ2400431.1 hypothetical protein [Phycisphaerae bacterium]
MSTRTRESTRPFVGHQAVRASWLATLTVTLACATAADVPAGWSPELADAFALYDAGQYAAAQERGRAIGARARSPAVRFDAEALEGLAMLRDPSRSQRLAGRSQIARLAQQDPTLLERPDVLLAGGVAHLALDETADALSMLIEAARRFEVQREWPRLGAAYLALAETWTKFGEWESLPKRLGIGAPQTAADARRIRRAQIERLRAAAAQQPALAPTAAAIDLVLARWLLDQPDGAEEGEALLARLAAARPMDASAADAALALAARHEQQRRWSLALDLYDAAARAPDPLRARRAAAARDEIRRPAIHPEFAEVIAPGEPVELRLRTRNLHDVRVELRHVDLVAWLEERRGFFAEAALPASGAVVFTQTLDTSVDTPFDWWRGGVTTASPLPPGAYVVLVSGRESGGAEQQARRLLLASHLRGVGLAGRDRGVLWAYADAGGPPDLGARATAAFWMAGTYVPARPEMRDGVAAFSLPDERLALRDRRWVALLVSGEHLALCRGQLPPKQPERDETARVLLAGAPRARAGDEYTLFGFVHEPSADAEPNALLTIDLVDGGERIRASQPAHVTHAGTFLATLRLPVDAGGELLGAIVRRGGRVIENARGRFVVQVASGDDARLELAVRGPRHMRPDQPPVLDVLATYPWGLPRADMRVRAICRALAPGAAPADDLNDRWARAGPIPTRAMLDGRGRARLLPPFGDLAVSESATVYGVWLTATGWDTRIATASLTVLSEPGPLLWALPVGAPPRVGEPMALSVGFHDAQGIVSGPPALEIRHGDTPVASPGVTLALDGWRSESWTPTSPGAHEAVVRMSQGDTETVRRFPFDVAADEGGGWLTCTAGRRAEGVRAVLRGTYRGPLLAAVLGGEPLAARAISMTAEVHEALLPAPRAARHARVVVIVPRGGAHCVVVAPPTAPDEEQPSLDVRFDAEPLRPASSIGVEIGCTFQPGQDAPPDAIVTARLVLPEPDFGLPWAGGEPRPAVAALAGDVRTSFESAAMFDGDGGARGGALERFAPLSDALVAAYLAGPTFWVDSRAARDGRARFEVPLPGDARRAILVVAAQTRADELVTRIIPLALDAGLSIVTDSPPELLVGDRTVVSARVVSARAANVRLRLDPGPGLRVESLRARPEAISLRPASNGSFELALPADAPVSLVATVEAVAAAHGQCAWAFEGPDGRQAEVSDYVVRSVPPPATAGGLRDGGLSAGAPVRIRRVLTVLERPRLTAPDDPLGPSEPAAGMPSTTWPQTPVHEHTRLRPGDLVLVREEIEVLGGLKHVRWEQAVPAHSHVSRSDQRDRQDIGRLGPPRADRAEWTARELPVGAYRNEYVLAMMRPGACTLAAPTVVADGVPLEVAAESVVLVVESP